MSTTIHKEEIGQLPDGRPIHAFSLANEHSVRATFLDFGATLIELEVPDSRGFPDDVVLGLDSIEDYIQANSPYLGSFVGRFANRIRDARFALDGQVFQLVANEESNHLHGGPEGLSFQLFDAEIVEGDTGEELHFKHVSPDGSMGFPGNVSIEVRISLSEDNGLKYQFSASTDAPTIINLTAHPYFNLLSNDSGTIRNHFLQVFADHFLPTDANNLPTGKLESVADGPFDFREPHVLDPRLDSANAQIERSGGLDHTFVLRKDRDPLSEPVLILSEESSGRKLSVFTDLPGIQVYTANALDGSITGKNGVEYAKHAGIAIEPQLFPDSPNIDSFPSCRLDPGTPFTGFFEFRFGAID